jgi:hypothetical protein
MPQRLSLPGIAGLGVGAALLLVAAAEAAPDARQIADSLVAATTANGRVQAVYDDATVSGDAVTISGYKITRSNAKTIVIPTILVSGAAMREGGGFTAASIAFDNGKATRGNDVVTWTTGLMEDAIIPSAEEVRAEADYKPFGKLAMTGIVIAESNLAQPVTAAEVRVLLQSAPDGSAGAFAAQVGGIHFPAEVLKGRPQEKAVLDALGYEEFDVNIAVAGAFDAASDSMTLNSLTINTADIGTLTVTARLSDISLGKIIASQSDAEIGADAKLDSLEIRFDNGGVVERALDMHAALIWGTREDAAAQVNAALPLVLHFIGNDAFQEKVVKAFGVFLVDPKSITLSAAPAAPVSLEKILATSFRDLDTIPDLLQADVSAN